MGPSDPLAGRYEEPPAAAAPSVGSPGALAWGAALGAMFGGVWVWQGVGAALLIAVCALAGAGVASVVVLARSGAVDVRGAWAALWRR